ncbi:hypothetical protein AAH991_38065 [Microbispora sp. ZYX-F-249]|uniref:Uncharacterized protein n=1 Tax=Microbispora maris TaxID=3144104 RepID=A0ABV0B1N1_9ACTN
MEHNQGTPGSVDDSKALGPLGRAWNDDLHPRDNIGRFAHHPGGGGGSRTGGSARGGGHVDPPNGGHAEAPPVGGPVSKGAMPDVVTTTTLPLKNGNLTIARTGDGGVTLTTPYGTGRLSKNDVHDFQYLLTFRHLDVGEDMWFKRLDDTPDGPKNTLVARIARTDKDD